jgi:hypothetical protein
MMHRCMAAAMPATMMRHRVTAAMSATMSPAVAATSGGCHSRDHEQRATAATIESLLRMECTP